MTTPGGRSGRADSFVRLNARNRTVTVIDRNRGRVIEGMDVVKRLLLAPVSPTAGAKEGMKGQMLVAPVKVVKAVRVPG